MKKEIAIKKILNGTASYDPDGTLTSYAWTQLSGSPVVLRRAGTATPVFRAPRVTNPAGVTLVFELTVTDNEGATAMSEVTINVLPITKRDR